MPVFNFANILLTNYRPSDIGGTDAAQDPLGRASPAYPAQSPFSLARNVISSHYVSCLFGSWMNAKLKPLDHFTG